MFFWMPFCGINVKPRDVARHRGFPITPMWRYQVWWPPLQAQWGQRGQKELPQAKSMEFLGSSHFAPENRPPRPKKESILGLPTVLLSGAFAVSFREGISISWFSTSISTDRWQTVSSCLRMSLPCLCNKLKLIAVVAFTWTKCFDANDSDGFTLVFLFGQTLGPCCDCKSFRA